MLYFKYAPLLSVTVKHSFYLDMVSADFSFDSLPGTAALLEGYGLVPRFGKGGLTLYQQRDQQNIPVQDIDEVIDLFFTMEARTDILNITDRFGAGKYWFSNLKSDGSYKNMLTHDALLGPEDVVDIFSGQTIQLNFAAGTLNQIDLKRILPVSGLQIVHSYAIDALQTELEVQVNQPGWYIMEKQLSAGGIQSSRLVLHDDLASATGFWGLLHLQLKPGAGFQAYQMELKPLETSWQYLLVESVGRSIQLDPADLALTYSNKNSRYPPVVFFPLKDPNAYPAALAKEVEAIKTSNKVREVYVFESDRTLQMMEGSLPEIKIAHAGDILADNISVPARAMKETKVLYKL
jgi:hypothetical protein